MFYNRPTIVAIIVCTLFLITFECPGQQSVDSVGKFTGLWFGTATSQVNGKNRASNIIWKIHHIDTAKQEIKMTELSESFEDSKDINEPSSKIYRGTAEDSVLHIQLKRRNGSTIKLNLKLTNRDGYILENSDTENSNKHEYAIFLGKISNDISPYVKPKSPASVEIIRSGI